LPFGGFANENFFVRAIDGRVFSARDFVGKAVVVNIWATWCKPCVAELPRLAEFYRAHSEQVIVLCVAERDDAMQLRRFPRANLASLPLIPDTGAEFSKWFPGTDIIPRTYVIAPDGRVVFVKNGSVDIAELQTAVTAAFAVRPAA